MNFLKSLFKNKENPINSYADFWNWFQKNEQKFYKVVKEDGDIHSVFFEELSPKLNALKEGFYYLTGMYNDTVAELVLTADGAVKNIAFVEELVAVAPQMTNWKITALKQPSKINRFGIEMDGYQFNEKKMHFYAIEHKPYPDEIDITITHEDFNQDNEGTISNGVYLTIENWLGELNSATKIDNISIINPKDATNDLVPFEKLKDFLIWREKEFVEKYKGFRHNIENDVYSSYEATLDNGLPLIAVMNTDLLNWDSKASHPWISLVEIKYDGNDNGMPDKNTYQFMNKIEEEIMEELKDSDGYLNIGRQTADSERIVYFACIDFRKPSKVLHNIKKKYQHQIELDFDIYKDKYWQSFNRFTTS